MEFVWKLNLRTKGDQKPAHGKILLGTDQLVRLTPQLRKVRSWLIQDIGERNNVHTKLSKPQQQMCNSNLTYQSSGLPTLGIPSPRVNKVTTLSRWDIHLHLRCTTFSKPLPSATSYSCAYTDICSQYCMKSFQLAFHSTASLFFQCWNAQSLDWRSTTEDKPNAFLWQYFLMFYWHKIERRRKTFSCYAP